MSYELERRTRRHSVYTRGLLLASFLWEMGLPVVNPMSVDVVSRLEAEAMSETIDEPDTARVERVLGQTIARFTTFSEKQTQQLMAEEFGIYAHDGSYFSSVVNIRAMQLSGMINPTVNPNDFLYYDPYQKKDLNREAFDDSNFELMAEDETLDEFRSMSLKPGDFVYFSKFEKSFSVLITRVDSKQVFGLSTLPYDRGYSIQEQLVMGDGGLIDQMNDDVSVFVWGMSSASYMKYIHETIPQLRKDAASDKNIFTLAAQISGDSLPMYSPDWYWDLHQDGEISPHELRWLNETYYIPSPRTFLGSATRYGPWQMMVPKLIEMGTEIREQMKRGWVLRASGEYGYHDELKEDFVSWIPHSKYARNINPNDLLLDNQTAPLYYFLSEKNLGGPYNEPLPVSYPSLNHEQQILYDLTSGDSNYVNSHFVPISAHQVMGPSAAVRSETFVSTLATKSPNDIGRRFLLFHRNSEGELMFYGVSIVVDVASRADWTGTGAMLNDSSVHNPLMIRQQLNPEGNIEQWGFDLPNHLYYVMGGSTGPVYGVIAIEADLIKAGN